MDELKYTWPEAEPNLTVKGKVGIGTKTPSQELEVIGDISATNLNLNGSLTIDKNLAVGGNFQLGTLSINAFSSDGNLADNSNLAVPTEQAVKTYVDNQISTRAALNGATNQNFATNNLTVGGNLRVSGNLEVQGDVIARDTEHIEGNVSLGDQDSDEVKITGVIRSGHSSGALRIDDALHTTGSLTVDGSISVRDAIATAQLSVTDLVSGSIKIENNLTLGGKVGIGTPNPRNTLGIRATRQSEELISFEDPSGRTKWHINQNLGGTNPGLNFVETGVADGRFFIKAGGNVGIGTTNPEAELHVIGKLLGAAQDTSGTALRICCGKTPEGSTNWQPYR
ncbi:MAG: hypothetical protein F6K50_19510, partial [Moorea sp. SIO3I7]|nr:hypothetical protein [Moorena sp. SIO3I7]